MLNETHDPSVISWVDSANLPTSEFPLQNLPYASYRLKGTKGAFRLGVGIGDYIADLGALSNLGVFDSLPNDVRQTLCGDYLNDFMATGILYWRAVRAILFRSFGSDSDCSKSIAGLLVRQIDSEFQVPYRIGDYTDFYTSIFHATNVGKLFRPDNPLLPNYHWVPIGYHGRSSSIVISGTSISRPQGQYLQEGRREPTLAPTAKLDYEVELGLIVGKSNSRGQPIAITDAEQHLFGMCLLNDWSARDVQAWEYQPLGPFLGKNFATTVSPWVVTMEALLPFREPYNRGKEAPTPLAYLSSETNRLQGAINIQIESWIKTPTQPSLQRLGSTNFRHSYWTVAQLITHHSVNGCNLQVGDLLGTGTQSGPIAGEEGALLEHTSNGQRPITLENGEQRTFLQDGDEIVLSAFCEMSNYPRIGFGTARGRVLPTPDSE